MYKNFANLVSKRLEETAPLYQVCLLGERAQLFLQVTLQIEKEKRSSTSEEDFILFLERSTALTLGWESCNLGQRTKNYPKPCHVRPKPVLQVCSNTCLPGINHPRLQPT